MPTCIKIPAIEDEAIMKIISDYRKTEKYKGLDAKYELSSYYVRKICRLYSDCQSLEDVQKLSRKIYKSDRPLTVREYNERYAEKHREFSRNRYVKIKMKKMMNKAVRRVAEAKQALKIAENKLEEVRKAEKDLEVILKVAEDAKAVRAAEAARAAKAAEERAVEKAVKAVKAVEAVEDTKYLKQKAVDDDE